MDVTYFGPRRPGPEMVIENAVTRQLPVLFLQDDLSWVAGSPLIGAGEPDLVVVSSHPQVSGLTQVDTPTLDILAYLRTVNCARLDTIAESVVQPKAIVSQKLDKLVEIEAISEKSHKFSVVPIWRNILPEVITIEAKVKDWKKAVDQAARNRIFAHRSFIALPEKLAMRVRSQSILTKLGIGLLSVDDDRNVSILRDASHHTPFVWTYYYEIALITATYLRSQSCRSKYQ